MLKRFLFVALAMILACLPSGLDAALIVAPPGAIDHAGNVDIPSDSFLVSLRPTYQQVYGASLFSSLAPGGGWIQSSWFRAGVSFRDTIAASVTGITIELSTTAKDVDALNPIFAENVGSDSQVFLSPLQVSRVTAGRIAGEAVESFGIVFASTPGFYYDPSKGNLLLQMKGFNVPTDFAIGGVNNSTAMSAVRGRAVGDLDGVATHDALETLFGIVPVPEPSVGAISTFSLLVLMLFYQRQKEAPRRKSRVTT